MWPDRVGFGVPGQVMLALVFTQSLSISTKSRPQLHRRYATKLQSEVCVILCVRTLWVSVSSAILLQACEPEGCGSQVRMRFISGSGSGWVPRSQDPPFLVSTPALS